MKALPQNTLPLATTSPFTRWGHAPARPAGTWSRTLAEASRGDDGIPAPARAGVTAPDARDAQSSEGKDASLRAAPLQLAASPSITATRVGTPLRQRAADDGDAALGVPLAVPAPASDIEDASQAPVPVQRAPARVGSSRSPAGPPQLHVHVEQHADGAAVWLGVPAGAARPGVDALLGALRQALPPGLALARLTCNGRGIYDPLAAHQEKP